MISKAHRLLFGSKRELDHEPLVGSPGKQKDKFVVTIIQQVRDPQQTCYAAFGEAMQISRSFDFYSHDGSQHKSQAARASCQPAGFSFREAVDMPVWGHQTPLQCLAVSYDHHALHFVHSCLPQGLYKGGIYLGKFSDAQPGEVIYDDPYLDSYDKASPYNAIIQQEKRYCHVELTMTAWPAMSISTT